MRCFHCMKELTGNVKFCPYCGKTVDEPNLPHHLVEGTVLNGRYYVGNPLGEGGFGITYVGFDLVLKIKVAIKEYFLSGCANRSHTFSNEVTPGCGSQSELFEKGKERFLQEAQSVAQFSQESGIVDVRDYFTENNTAYIVMEYIEGVTLFQYLRDNGVMKADRLINYMLPIMQTLEKMHTHNIIHRDISPDNIMVSKDGSLKLLDFGAARYFSGSAVQTMSVVIKQSYAPYEQYRRNGNQGPWTDVYGLCATIYKCITGIAPPDALDRIVKDELKPPAQLGADISPKTEQALLRGLEIYPENRWQSVGQLINALAADEQPNVIIEEPQKTVAADDLITPKRHSFRRATLIIYAAAAVALAVFAVFVFTPFFAKQTDSEPQAESKQSFSEITIPLYNAASAPNEVITATQAEASSSAEEISADEKPSSFAEKTTSAESEKHSAGETQEIIKEFTDETTLSARYYHAVGLKTDGSLISAGWNKFGQCNIDSWTNISAVATGYGHTLGLKNNGTVVAVGDNAKGQCNVGEWKNIISVSGGYMHSVGLKADGTVVATGLNDYGQCNVSGWKNIVAVSAGYSHTVALKSDGTVVATGWNEYGQTDLGGWKDIVSVCAEGVVTLGLKSDGTVASAGDNAHGQRNITGWKNIVSVGEGDWHTAGLKSDGTVVAAGDNADGQCNVSGWNNIVAISVGAFSTYGLRSDGTVVATGRNKYGQCDVSGWTDIRLP